MFLDTIDNLTSLDPQDMLKHITDQPDHYEAAWTHALKMPLPTSFSHVRQVVIAGMGGSAIGGDLLASYLAAYAPVPIQVVRGYDLPTYAQGNHTLVIASSFSGNTEETLAAYEQAFERGTQILGITTGGKLAEYCIANGHTLWQFEDTIGQPRAAIGWSLGLLLGLAHRLNWGAPTLAEDFRDGVANLRKYRERYQLSSPAIDNPAKRQAGQYIGRIPVFIGAGVFEVAARRWKGQMNENGKFWAMFDGMPEMNHNTIVGIQFPEPLMSKICIVFITSREFDHPRSALRHSLTFKLFLENGFMVDKFRPRGHSLLAQLMHGIFYGDYVSYYAAIGMQANPTTITPIMELKEAMAFSAD